ncbi:MAG: enoyl-CoA hydratase/isomerase family protein [Chloroflexi bacterium]|nr:enoyl-CoA hydratase/isomerase family protein [Chloroflexota bacterium]
MTYNTILAELSQGVFTLTLNRPDKLNALNDAVAAEVQAALKSAERDETARCIVLTGAGKGFCAGQDLDALRNRPDELSFRQHLLKTYHPIAAKLRSIEKPVLCAINGAAAGAGLGLALACDIRYAAAGAKLRFAFSGIGLAPDTGASFFLPRLMGLSRALEFAYTNDPITAEEALTLGLVNKVVPVEELQAAVRALAVRLAQAPTKALGLTKRAMNAALNFNIDQALDYEAHLQEVAGHTEDHREGVAAFLDKRPPKFKGK